MKCPRPRANCDFLLTSLLLVCLTASGCAATGTLDSPARPPATVQHTSAAIKASKTPPITMSATAEVAIKRPAATEQPPTRPSNLIGGAARELAQGFANELAQSLRIAARRPEPSRTPTATATTPAPTMTRTAVPPAASASAPTMIFIPALGVEARVEAVGLTEDGAMGVPKDWHNAGWFDLGFGPGQLGNMVMTGHVDTPFGDNGLFKGLNQLAIGDRIYLHTADGTSYGYIVEYYRYYPYDEAPLEEIFGFAEEPRLNLVTCRGDWNRQEATYDQRLVVYARQTHAVEPEAN